LIAARETSDDPLLFTAEIRLALQARKVWRRARLVGGRATFMRVSGEGERPDEERHLGREGGA